MAPEHGVEPGELLKRADLALYNVKSSGPQRLTACSRTKCWRSSTPSNRRRRELREAIAQGQFELHYQPVVDIETRELCGVETLVRWRHPVKGMIAPDQFIPLAESTGLIVPLGEWILRAGLRRRRQLARARQGRGQHLGDPVQEGQPVRDRSWRRW